jgi:hypothetical protein
MKLMWGNSRQVDTSNEDKEIQIQAIGLFFFDGCHSTRIIF